MSGNPVLYGDPSGKFLPLLIGGLVIGAVAMGTWNLMVEQGKGGIDNVRSGNVYQSEHYSDVEWVASVNLSLLAILSN